MRSDSKQSKPSSSESSMKEVHLNKESTSDAPLDSTISCDDVSSESTPSSSSSSVELLSEMESAISVQLNFPLPDDCYELFNEETVKSIEDRSQTKITIVPPSEKEKLGKNGYINVVGSLLTTQNAYKIMSSLLAVKIDDTSVEALIFHVPNRLAGIIIGRSGGSIAHVESMCGTNVLVAPNLGQSQRSIKISGGDANARRKTQSMIMTKLNNFLIKDEENSSEENNVNYEDTQPEDGYNSNQNFHDPLSNYSPFEYTHQQQLLNDSTLYSHPYNFVPQYPPLHCDFYTTPSFTQFPFVTTPYYVPQPYSDEVFYHSQVPINQMAYPMHQPTIDYSSQASVAAPIYEVLQYGAKTSDDQEEEDQRTTKSSITNSVVMLCRVPESMCGYLIGNKGISVHDMEISFGVAIRYAPVNECRREKGANYRGVSIIGQPKRCYNTFEAMNQRLEEVQSHSLATIVSVKPSSRTQHGRRSHDSSSSDGHYDKEEQHFQTNSNAREKTELASLSILIPNHAVGVLIGYRGRTINGITESSGACISISKEILSNNLRSMTIVGTYESIQMATKLIFTNCTTTKKQQANEDLRVN